MVAADDPALLKPLGEVAPPRMVQRSLFDIG